jgi:hypothetical protein
LAEGLSVRHVSLARFNPAVDNPATQSVFSVDRELGNADQGSCDADVPIRKYEYAGTQERAMLVVVSAAQVVAAVGADQLASMADEPMRARRADLAVVLDGLIIAHGTDRTTL